MRLPALLFSDPHFTVNPKDEYRWKLWSWLRQKIDEESIKTLICLGDLTDAKDYHSSTLVNRLVHEIVTTAGSVERFHILMGNHDYLREGEAFFSFLNHLDHVRFITQRWDDALDDAKGPPCIFLPHTKTPAKDWEELDCSQFEYVFMHQTIKGAVASNGMKMEGEQIPDLSAWSTVYSGDIHVPQKIRGLEYIGSPYHVHFGDNFKPRCILIDQQGKSRDLRFPSLQRLVLNLEWKADGLDHRAVLATKPGDQVKVRVRLDRADLASWPRVKREAARLLQQAEVEIMGLELVIAGSEARKAASMEGHKGVGFLSDPDVVSRFCEAEDLGGDVLDLGLKIIDG